MAIPFQLDTRIPMSYQPGPSVLEQAQSIMSLADLMDKRKLTQLQSLEMQKQIARENALREAGAKSYQEQLNQYTAPPPVIPAEPVKPVFPEITAPTAPEPIYQTPYGPAKTPELAANLMDLPQGTIPESTISPTEQAAYEQKMAAYNQQKAAQEQQLKDYNTALEERKKAEKAAKPEARIPEMYKYFMTPEDYKTYLTLGTIDPNSAMDYMTKLSNLRLQAAHAQYWTKPKEEDLLKKEKLYEAKMGQAAGAFKAIKESKDLFAQKNLYDAGLLRLQAAGYDTTEMPSTEEFDPSNPEHLAVLDPIIAMSEKGKGGFAGAFAARMEAVKQAHPEMPLDQQYLLATAPGTVYTLSEEGINKAAQRSAAMAGASSRAQLAPDIVGGKGGLASIQQTAKNAGLKVDAANIAMTAMPPWDPKTGKFNETHLTPQVASDLALASARLASPTGQISEALFYEIKQGTLSENISRALAFVGIKTPGTTQQNLKNIKYFIAREGKRAQITLDRALSGKVSKFSGEEQPQVSEEEIFPKESPAIKPPKKTDEKNAIKPDIKSFWKK